MATVVVDLISAIQHCVKPRHDDGVVDRLHYVLAPMVLMFMACFHGLKQYFGQPILCWTPAEIRKPWLKYLHGYCFVENTYFVAFDEFLPMRRVDRESRQIHYYQWVPFMLMGQALLFVLPKAICFMFSNKNAFNVGLLLERFRALEKRDPKGKRCWVDDQGAAQGLARGIQMARRDRIRFRRGLNLVADGENEYPLHPSKSPWTWIVESISEHSFTLIYLGYKFANLFVVLLQLHLLNTYIDGPENYSFWGFEVLIELMGGRNWRETGLFPRVTFCDLEVRQPQRNMAPHRYSFQCLLNMNIFNEKIYLAIWFGLLGLALVAILDLAIWIRRWLSWHSSEHFIRKQLADFRNIDPAFSDSDELTPKGLRCFVQQSLGRDTVTLLRIVQANCPPLVTAQLVGNLWKYHLKALSVGFHHHQMISGGVSADGIRSSY